MTRALTRPIPFPAKLAGPSHAGSLSREHYGRLNRNGWEAVTPLIQAKQDQITELMSQRADERNEASYDKTL